MTDEQREKAIGCLVFAAFGLVGLGAIGFVMLMGGGALRMANSQGKDPSLLILSGFAALSILLGFGCAILALVWGLGRNRRARSAEPEFARVRILARYALMPGTSEMMFSDFDPDYPGIRFFARVRFENGAARELQCAYPVFSMLGEGMTGTATVQGDWISIFQPARAVEG
ncbi:MAG: DUF2500 domain-containing protein [Fimbriimonadaceae bacterium]|nr:hypothetical protein [Chthonomonadaceae bacterium]MCO5298256.1 DUF2500 domain-containing protein [Fimbriimonadaceae bacterium]